MRNHFHLVVETPEPNLSAGMKWLLQTYSSRFNRRHKFFGHGFGGRFKAPLIDGSGTGYLRTAAEYVHLNPIRARLLKEHQPPTRMRGAVILCISKPGAGGVGDGNEKLV